MSAKFGDFVDFYIFVLKYRNTIIDILCGRVHNVKNKFDYKTASAF